MQRPCATDLGMQRIGEAVQVVRSNPFYSGDVVGQSRCVQSRFVAWFADTNLGIFAAKEWERARSFPHNSRRVLRLLSAVGGQRR